MKFKASSNPDSLEQGQAGSLSEFVEKLERVEPNATAILVGSAARGQMSWRSDIDLLVITPDAIGRLERSPRMHVHYETRKGFAERLSGGDEFASWASRYGKVLLDAQSWWESVARSDSPWPDWSKKLEHAGKRLKTAAKALADNDTDAAEEELLMAASHCARAELLKALVFPLSRPELPRQLESIGARALSRVLAQLILGGLDSDRLCSVMTFLRTFQEREARAADGRSTNGD